MTKISISSSNKKYNFLAACSKAVENLFKSCRKLQRLREGCREIVQNSKGSCSKAVENSDVKTQGLTRILELDIMML